MKISSKPLQLIILLAGLLLSACTNTNASEAPFLGDWSNDSLEVNINKKGQQIIVEWAGGTFAAELDGVKLKLSHPLIKDVTFVKASDTLLMGGEVLSRGSKLKERNCVKNLYIIDGAKEQWALEWKKKNGDAVTTNTLMVYLRVEPKCPSGGTYTLNLMGKDPTCSVPGHELPQPMQ